MCKFFVEVKVFNKKITIISIFLTIATIANGAQSKKYSIVIDAGSSGTRLYLYSSQVSVGTKLNKYEQLLNKRNRIRLSDYKDKPDLAFDAIAPLLKDAKSYLKDYDTKNVVVNVLATAGMRLIPVANQNAIYVALRLNIASNGFKVGLTKTITGEDEGLYTWADVNYLQGADVLGNPSGIIEIGGASMQIAYPSSTKGYRKVKINNKDYDIYSQTWLGFGNNEMLDLINASQDRDYCYPKGLKDGKIVGNFNFDNCASRYNSLINHEGKIFPIYSDQSIIGVSGLYYTLAFWKINEAPIKLESKIKETCTLNYADLKLMYPNVESGILNKQCANAVYTDQLLKNLHPNMARLTSYEKINGVPITWALGFLIVDGN